MAQGTRGRWVRVATTGFGVVLCTGLLGCMNDDKPKETKNSQPKPGLPGTPTLPQNNSGAAKWQPPGTGQPYGGPGANIQPTGGFGTAQPGAGGVRPGATGLNTNTSGGVAPTNFPAQPGYTGSLNAPAQQGAYPAPSVLPVGGPVGNAPVTPAGGVASAYSPTPPAPSLLLDGGPLPPPAPHSGTDHSGGIGVLPPTPSSPIAPPSVPPAGPTYQPLKGGY